MQILMRFRVTTTPQSPVDSPSENIASVTSLWRDSVILVASHGKLRVRTNSNRLGGRLLDLEVRNKPLNIESL
jgi:hypothetical protein